MNNELQHIGVLGMKWGRRKSSSPSSDHLKTKELRKKKVSEMSNDELKAITNRMQLEKQYKDLQPKRVNYGKFIAGKTLAPLANKTLDVVFTAAAAYAGKKIWDYAKARYGL